MCLCANVVIRINRGSALHEHQTIIFRKSHLGCFDLTDESIYMTERVYSQSTLHTVGINQDYFVFVQIWEQRCLGKKGGRREDWYSSEGGGETAFQAAALCSPGVKAANARFTCKCLDCETDITHLESRGESQRIPG